MQKNRLINWVIHHSFGLITTEKQALSLLLAITVFAIGFSFFINTTETSLPNANPHESWVQTK